jgi:NitT/TauT family transport system substrate-binding protein
MRRILGHIGLLLATAMVAGSFASTANAEGLTKVTFMMDWVIGGKHAMFYPALVKGYYKEEGLDVTLVRGHGSSGTVQAIDQGHAQFGFADAGVLTLKAAQGAHVKYLGAIFDNQPLQFLALESTGIKTPKDFIGKKYGTPLQSMSGALFPGFMRLNGLDPKKVDMINVEIASTIPALFSGQIDLASGYSNSGTVIAWATAAKENRPVVTIPAGKYGLDIYSNGIIASDATVKNNPELVKKFMRATYRGLKYGVEHPQEALDMLYAAHPEIRSKPIASAQYREALKDFLTPEGLKHGLGWMDPGKWKRTRDIIFEAYKIKSDLKAEDIYTPDFLPVVKVDNVPKKFLETKVFGRY